MIPVEKLRELMPKDKKYSDEEIIEVGNQLEGMAQLAFDVWLDDKNKKQF